MRKASACAAALRFPLVCLSLLGVSHVSAQVADTHVLAKERDRPANLPEAALASRLVDHQRASMTVLLAGGAASVGAGLALMASASDDSFLFWGGVQHLSWGLVNVLIGASSLYGASPRRAGQARPPGFWRARRRRMRKVFWLNAGLDVLYIASAALLWALPAREAVRGSGAAIVGQGGFLLVFDVTAALSLP